MRFGSLFSGIGGLDLGLERAGMACAWQVEIDDYCNKVLEKHWPSVPRFRDVREAGKHNLPDVDLIAGGFPCQPVSLAGEMRGEDDERWLWPEFARIIRELRPRYALLENVPGLLVHGMGSVLGDLAACGYDAEWDVLSAASFGAPHIRNRLFVVAYSDHWRTGRRKQFAASKPQARDTSNANSERQPELCRVFKKGGRRSPNSYWRTTKPPLCRMDDGVSHRSHRLRALGNAVVPQCAEWIGRRILEQE